MPRITKCDYCGCIIEGYGLQSGFEEFCSEECESKFYEMESNLKEEL